METLIRSRVKRGLIWVCTVCLCPTKRTLGLYGPRREKTCLRRFANNKGADQPAHPRSLISAFLIRFLESTISKLATSEISIFLLVPVAEQAGLNLNLSETPKTGFVETRPIWVNWSQSSKTYMYFLVTMPKSVLAEGWFRFSVAPFYTFLFHLYQL